jgi:hypothetical protein
MARSLDIFKFMSDLGKETTTDPWVNLTDAEKKDFSALVITRWLSGTKDAGQIIALNERINPYSFSLAAHPRLQGQLLAASVKGAARYKWIPAKGTKKTGVLDVVAAYYGVTRREAATFGSFSDEDVTEMAQALGYQKDEVTKVVKSNGN